MLKSVAIEAQATSCSNVRGVFSRSRAFLVCLVQVSATQFCSIPAFLTARVSVEQMCQYLRYQPPLRKWDLLNGSLPDLEGTGYRASTMEEKINEMFIQIAKLPLLLQSISRFENCVQTLSQTVASYDAKSQPVVPARQALGSDLDIVMVPQLQGPFCPTARGLLTTTGTQDVDLIPFPAQRMNMHEVSFCFDFHVNNIAREYLLGSTDSGQRPTHQPSANQLEYTAKQVPCLPDSYSKQEPNVRTLWPDIRMMVSSTKLMVLFATPKQISRSASPSHLKTTKLENNLRLFRKFCVVHKVT